MAQQVTVGECMSCLDLLRSKLEEVEVRMSGLGADTMLELPDSAMVPIRRPVGPTPPMCGPCDAELSFATLLDVADWVVTALDLRDSG